MAQTNKIDKNKRTTESKADLPQRQKKRLKTKIRAIYEEENMSMSDIKRGDIFYVADHGEQIGSEQHPGRPAVIISNDANNKHSETVEIVYCRTQNKTNLPTHVWIRGIPRDSIALCEQVTTVSKERLLFYVRSCTEKEMHYIDEAVLISLGITIDHNGEDKCDDFEKIESAESNKGSVAVEAERDTYKALYESILEMVLPSQIKAGGRNGRGQI